VHDLIVYFQMPLRSADFTISRDPERPWDIDSEPDYHTGPYFRGWLPDDDSDDLMLHSDDPDATIVVRFQEWDGFFPDGTRVPDDHPFWKDRRAFQRGPVQEGGNLHGVLTLSRVSDGDIAALSALQSPDATAPERDRVAALSSRVQKALARPLSDVVRLLRVVYGQYWLPDIPVLDQDSQMESFFSLFLIRKWGVDDDDWSAMRPFTLPAVAHHERPDPTDFAKEADRLLINLDQLLTEDDWPTVQALASQRLELSPALVMFSRAHQYLDQGDVWNALVTGVIALEYALADAVQRRERLLDRLISLDLAPEEWYRIPPAKVMDAVTADIDAIAESDRALAAAAITTRNNIVHRRLALPSRAPEQTAALLNVVWALFPNPRPKRPSERTAIFRPSLELYWDITDDQDDMPE
jgi:hypothetical protein